MSEDFFFSPVCLVHLSGSLFDAFISPASLPLWLRPLVLLECFFSFRHLISPFFGRLYLPGIFVLVSPSAILLCVVVFFWV